ncbi:hypothetical protein H920_18566 [Fukomys damarensis]|uniref:Uncharacterized protein n=1 Tax=Fukomys damarensis TaxID=885580 RepID=A0A091CRQ5_FUKDA|nr:hypothetical protein H920_18566 [Fukomys damarensis]
MIAVCFQNPGVLKKQQHFEKFSVKSNYSLKCVVEKMRIKREQTLRVLGEILLCQEIRGTWMCQATCRSPAGKGKENYAEQDSVADRHYLKLVLYLIVLTDVKGLGKLCEISHYNRKQMVLNSGCRIRECGWSPVQVTHHQRSPLAAVDTSALPTRFLCPPTTTESSATLQEDFTSGMDHKVFAVRERVAPSPARRTSALRGLVHTQGEFITPRDPAIFQALLRPEVDPETCQFASDSRETDLTVTEKPGVSVTLCTKQVDRTCCCNSTVSSGWRTRELELRGLPHGTVLRAGRCEAHTFRAHHPSTLPQLWGRSSQLRQRLGCTARAVRPSGDRLRGQRVSTPACFTPLGCGAKVTARSTVSICTFRPRSKSTPVQVLNLREPSCGYACATAADRHAAPFPLPWTSTLLLVSFGLLLLHPPDCSPLLLLLPFQETVLPVHPHYVTCFPVGPTCAKHLYSDSRRLMVV